MEGRRPTSGKLGVASPSLPHSAVGGDEPAPAASIYLECSCTRACHCPRPRPLNADHDPNVALASYEQALHVSPDQIPGYGSCLLRYAAAGRGESDRGFDRIVFGEWRISLQAPRGGPALASSSVHLSAPRDVLGGDLDTARRRNELGPQVGSRHVWIRSHQESVHYAASRMERLLLLAARHPEGISRSYRNAAMRSSSEATIVPPLPMTNVSSCRLTATPSSPAWRKSERSPKQIFSRAAA